MKGSLPAWVAVVLATLAAQGVVAGLRPRGAPRLEIWSRALAGELDPRRMNARELRQLPGIGAELAAALVAARASHPARADFWLEAEGIGPVREGAILAWCRAHGVQVPGREGAVLARYPPGVSSWAEVVLLGVAAALAACRESPEPTPDAPAPADARAEGVRTLALCGGSLHALGAGPAAAPAVLLLHGARYSAATWKELGTLELLARAGYRVVALDWPGYGATPRWSSDPEPAELLAKVCAELGPERVHLVAPSLGGRFAFAFAAEHPERVAGLVAIAPAGADAPLPERWPPTLLLWGERDEVVPLAQGRALAERLHARLEVLSGATHPCYLEAPERFHGLLLDFLAETSDVGR